MPASSSSATSSQRLAWRLPGALVWASSSTSSSAGPAGQRRVEVELLEQSGRDRRSARRGRTGRSPICAAGLGAAMGFDEAGDDVHALACGGAGPGRASRRFCRRRGRRRGRSSAARAAPLPPASAASRASGSGRSASAGHLPRRYDDFAASSARLSPSTFTRLSPMKPSRRALRMRGRRARATSASGRCRAAATRGHLPRRVLRRDVGVEAGRRRWSPRRPGPAPGRRRLATSRGHAVDQRLARSGRGWSAAELLGVVGRRHRLAGVLRVGAGGRRRARPWK